MYATIYYDNDDETKKLFMECDRVDYYQNGVVLRDGDKSAVFTLKAVSRICIGQNDYVNRRIGQKDYKAQNGKPEFNYG
jgi:hypothetical protein